jgi:predicted RNA-binding Zn-ribbon protein involved in translation (DUF1610 family)
MRLRRPWGQRKKQCSGCGSELEPERQGKYRYCRNCHKEYMRKLRAEKKQKEESCQANLT